MGKPSDRVQLFTPEQAAAAFDGRADLTALVLKADIGQAETAAMIYVTKGDYTEPWPHQDPANRGTLLVPHKLDNVLQRLHEAWLKALLALGPGDRDLDPKSPEITALQGLALTSTDKRLHRNELRRWAALNGFEFDEFGATGQQTAPAKANPPDEAWKEEARAQARTIIERQAAKDLHPNLVVIADEIAKEWRKLEKFGPKGTPLSGAYIKRHALQGCGIAIDREAIISTSKGRGK